MSTIAVIGHTGFVGASIVDALQARGDTPTTIDLPRVIEDQNRLARALMD